MQGAVNAKPTTMTRTARYNAETNTFRELPGMEKPEEPYLRNYAYASEHYDAYAIFGREMERYEADLAECRTIPCHESCRSVFKDQEVYEEGKDYKLYQYEDRLTLAYPIVKDGEDELWKELITQISNDHMQHDYSGSYIKTDEAIQQLKKHFTLTPR